MSATSAATRTCAIRRVSFAATASSPTAREPLTSTTSPGRRSPRARSQPPRRPCRPRAASTPSRAGRVPARERADGDELGDAGARDLLADLAVEGRRASSPSSAISPSTATRRRPPASSARCVERRAHRDRVRVVAVVDQRHAAASSSTSSRSGRELDLERPVRRRGMPSTSQTVSAASVLSELVARRVARLEPRSPPADPETPGLVDRAEPADVDVGAREVRLEQRLLGHDRDTAGRQRLDQLGLRARDVLDRPDELEVDGRDVRDQRDVRPRERREPGDLAEAAHPHLDDAELGVAARSGRASAARRARC